jgi:hypothetical protein
LFFILYADKTRLSSFGTEKGYPVMARIANLPVDILNGEGIGGGQVVGWLPIVSNIYQQVEFTCNMTFLLGRGRLWRNGENRVCQS